MTETPMTDEEMKREQPHIWKSQHYHHTLHEKLTAAGFEQIDVLIGAVYASMALATSATGGPIKAIEWLRDAADNIERQILDEIAAGYRAADGYPTGGKPN